MAQSSLEDMRMQAAQSMFAELSLIERDSSLGDWVVGDRYGVSNAEGLAVARWG